MKGFAWLLLLATACCYLASAAVYSVGPSHEFQTIAQALNLGLEAGDQVLIHAGPMYNEKFVINNAGTRDFPIIIRGVPDSNGSLPIIDGNGAITPLTLDYWNEPRSLIKIGGATIPGSQDAANIRIENLQLQNRSILLLISIGLLSIIIIDQQREIIFSITRLFLEMIFLC